MRKFSDLCWDMELVEQCLGPQMHAPFHVTETRWVHDVLEDPQVTAEVVNRLVRASRDYVRRAAAKHPLCTIESVLTPEAGRLAQVARAYATKSPKELDMLASVGDGRVNEEVVKNKNVSDDTLIRLLPMPFTMYRPEYSPTVNRAMIKLLREGKHSTLEFRSALYWAPGLSDDDRRWLGIQNCAKAPDLSREIWEELYALGLRTELVNSCLRVGRPELLDELATSTEGETQSALVIWLRDSGCEYEKAKELVEKMVPIRTWDGKPLGSFSSPHVIPNPPRAVARAMIEHKNRYSAWHHYVVLDMSDKLQG